MNTSQFPVEIISLILESLTPGFLISVSQTCRYFRSIVAPEPFHVAQRLLVFELLPEFGGAIPILCLHRNSFIIPHLEDVESWDAIRYACTGCLRIRHHRWFDNHSIFRLRMRKPYLNSPVANALAEPGDIRARWRRRNEQATSAISEERYWPRQYHEACTGGLTDEEEERSELELCGKHRDRRLCIECHYSRGGYQRKTKSNLGSPRAPAIKTRPQYLRRWQPPMSSQRDGLPHKQDLIGDLPPKAPFLVPHSAFMIRCSFCGIWQGLPDFRQLVGFYAGMPEPETDTTTWQCNACVRLNYGANEQTKLIISYRRKQRGQEWQSLCKQLKFTYKRVAHFRRSLASDDMHLLERYLGQLAGSLARYQQNIV